MEATIPLHKAAALHGIHPRTLQRRLEKLGRSVPKTGRGNLRHVLVRDVEAVMRPRTVKPFYP
jgi:hypothetical protein